MSRRRRKKLPTDPFTANIETLTHDGRGLAHINGKATFISEALAGETVKFIYKDSRGRFDEGQAIEILQGAPERVSPACPYFSICGGCSMQHLQHPSQLALKQNTLLEQLQHFGNITPSTVLPPLTGPIWHYRRKARLGVRYVKNKESVLVGFREKRSRYITNMDDCKILHPWAAQLIQPLRNFIASLQAFQSIPQIEVAVDDHRVALVFRHLEDLSASDLEKLTSFSEANNIYCFLQPGGLDSIHLLYPENNSPLLSYQFSEYGLIFKFMPTDFSQVNLEINKKMIARAMELLNPQPEHKILDLFCGFGNFTLPLAKYCQQIVGVEGSEIAVKRAKMNAEHNQITNANFYCFDLTKDFTNTPWLSQKYDTLLLDPPRSGAKEVVEQMGNSQFKQILYISCNPATLARDAGILVHNHGYRLVKAGIMDMFPHTTHVESIALFEKT